MIIFDSIKIHGNLVWREKIEENVSSELVRYMRAHTLQYYYILRKHIKSKMCLLFSSAKHHHQQQQQAQHKKPISFIERVYAMQQQQNRGEKEIRSGQIYVTNTISHMMFCLSEWC